MKWIERLVVDTIIKRISPTVCLCLANCSNDTAVMINMVTNIYILILRINL